MTEPKNALLKQYKRQLAMSGARLHVTDEALRAVARIAMNKNTGARGLRSILENLLTEPMFHVRRFGSPFVSSRSISNTERIVHIALIFRVESKAMHVHT